HPFNPEKKHGFIDSQRYGIDVFRQIPRESPVIVAEAVWQYSHHVLAGLYHHKGPILTVANWSGEWPGLVGMLNLNACLTKAGIQYDSLWSEQFRDEYFLHRLEMWLEGKRVQHDLSHVQRFDSDQISGRPQMVGKRVATDLTDDQILDQCRMYIAALRIADDFGCAAIGIQYQQGLKDLTPASDLVEGLLNNADRPPVAENGNGRILYDGRALPHFNEVDECAGIDALITNRIWNELNLDPETTLHDLRYGEQYNGHFVWVLEISGAAPPNHFIGGYRGAVSERQPPMYFPLGGGTLKGISKPGEIVWSRIFVGSNKLKADLRRATVVDLPREEVERRWASTTPQWPIMNAVLHRVSRDQLMARHKSNHIQVAYGRDAGSADEAMLAKAVAFRELGIEVYLCGCELTADGARTGLHNAVPAP